MTIPNSPLAVGYIFGEVTNTGSSLIKEAISRKPLSTESKIAFIKIFAT